jgi:acyl dehydratase
VPNLYWEDFAVGSVAHYGPRPITREEIIDFASEFDPQPMHLDDAAARASMLGGLAASGWHSCALLMRLMVDGLLRDAHSLGSPGVEEVQWLRPVRPGDHLTARSTVLETRASRSRPDLGLVKLRCELLDQHGAIAMSMVSTLMVGRR